MHQRWFIVPDCGLMQNSSIAAPCSRQLQSRHLTELFLRVLNREVERNLYREFQPRQFFCASMRTVPAHWKFFSLQRNRPAVRSLLSWKMSAFILQSF